MLRTMKINYDKKFDVLYVGLKDTGNSYGEDTGDIIYLRDIETDELTGITVMGFCRLSDSEYLRDEFEKLGLDVQTVKNQITNEYF